MKKVLFLIIILIIFSVLSCEKDDLTLPVQVEFEFGMNPFHMEGSSKPSSFFDIDQGTIVIEAIEFDGRRDQGEDYYFTSRFDSLVTAHLHTMSLSQKISYDIPQGIYNRIELNLSLGDGNEDALCLKGRLRRGPMEETSIRFEYAFQEQIRIRAKNNQGNEQIVLSKESDRKAKIVFDVPYLFQRINMNMIQNAETINEEGEKIIVINTEMNTEIFNLVASRINNSMRVIFD